MSRHNAGVLVSYVILLAGFLGVAVPSTKVEASTILLLDEHDYVYPRLSPDGRKLVVARAIVRPDGAETTEVLLVELSSGAIRELVSQREAEAEQVYETYVIGLRWLNDRHVVISLSDGDVGGTELTIDADHGTVLRAESEEGDDFLPSEMSGVAADAIHYRRHFTKEELERSLGSSAVRLPSGQVVVQRSAREAATQPMFLITPDTKSIQKIANVPSTLELSEAMEIDGELVLLLVGENMASVRSWRAGRTRTLATWSFPLRNQCTRIETISPKRLFVFARPCVRSEPANGTLWEITGGRAIRRTLADDLDELSASADGSRIAIATWSNGRRVVRVLENWAFADPAR